MLGLLLNNYLLIINILIPFLLGLYFVLKHKEYSAKEFGIQIGITCVILISAFGIGYGVSDIYTQSYSTTKINKFVYEESWTERVTYTETYSCGKSTCTRTKVRYDYHPDRYYYTTDVDTIFTNSISKKQYQKAKDEFGEILTKRSHSDQSSYGDGRIYDVYPNKNIVHSYVNSELNYIYASKKNIIKSPEFKYLEENYKSELIQYPKFFSDTYGNNNFNRIINSHLIDKEIKDKLQKDLEQLSINLNTNPILYLTTSIDRNFAYVVKGYYKDMYYNDAMLVIGVKDNKIIWIEPISLSKSAEFKVHSTNLTDNFNDLIPKFSDVIKNYWQKPNLEEYSYLSGDIDLPFWYELLIVIINIIGSYLAFRFMFNHQL